MMNPHQTALISLLLGSFPTFQSGDAQAALAAYEVVINEADERDVQPGVMMLINGMYPSHDGRFAPTAPQLAGAIRVCRNKRLESERYDRVQIGPPPEKELTPEERERGKEVFAKLAADLAAKYQTDDASAEAARKAQWDKVNARFQPDMSEAATAERLGFRYTAGDPEGAEDAAYLSPNNQDGR